MSIQFLEQTAKDYDMDLWDVKKISDEVESDYEKFYIGLELFIKLRAN